MRKKHPACNIVLFLCLLPGIYGCGSRFGIERIDTAVSSLSVDRQSDGRAVVRSLYSDITVRQIRNTEWNDLLHNDTFFNRKNRKESFRVPGLNFFLVTVKNTGGLPLVIESVSIVHTGKMHSSLQPAEIRRMFKSPVYDFFNFEKILAPRRLLSEDYSLKKLDFQSDAIDYKLDFIPPDDTLIQILAFEYPPVAVRRYSIEFNLSLNGAARKISFEIDRREFRTEGAHFAEEPDSSEELIR